MADEKKISGLTEASDASASDEFVMVNKAVTSGADASASGQTSKITLGNLRTALFGGSSGSTGNDIIFAENGGNVGIGTDAPERVLTIKHGAPGIRFEDTDGDPAHVTQIGSYLGTLYFDSDLANPTGSAGRTSGKGFVFRTDANTTESPSGNELLVINQNGNVGIGTDSPEAKLHVKGTNVSNSTIGDKNTHVILGSGRHKLSLIEERVEIPTPNNWDGVTLKLQKFVDSTPMQSINFVHEHGAASSDNHIDIYTGGHVTTDPIFNTRFHGNGCIGMGTDDPKVKLHVTGTTILKDRFVFGSLNSSVADGKYLQFGWAGENEDIHTIQSLERLAGGGGWRKLVLNENGGNVGIGGIPVDYPPTTTALQLGARAHICATDTGHLNIVQNAYQNHSNTKNLRYVHGKSARYRQYDGEHIFSHTTENGPGGDDSNDSEIEWKESMRIDGKGVVNLGTRGGDTRNGSRKIGLHETSKSWMVGNNDWTPMIQAFSWIGGGAFNVTPTYYSEAGELPTAGVVMEGANHYIQIPVRMPVDPEGTYRIKVRAEKFGGSDPTRFYCGVESLDNDFSPLHTDHAHNWNYGVAHNVTLEPDTGSHTLMGYFRGYNAPQGTDHSKFDPNAKYFNLVILANYWGEWGSNDNAIGKTKTAEEVGKTIIEMIEVEKMDSAMIEDGVNHMKFGSNSLGGRMTTVYGNVNVTGSATHIDFPEFLLGGSGDSFAGMVVVSAWNTGSGTNHGSRMFHMHCRGEDGPQAASAPLGDQQKSGSCVSIDGIQMITGVGLRVQLGGGTNPTGMWRVRVCAYGTSIQ